MFRRIINKVFGVGLGILLAVSVASNVYGFDKEANVDALNLNPVSYDTYVTISAMGTALGVVLDDNRQWRYREGYYQLSGSGYVPLSGYVVTAAHVVNPEMVKIRKSTATSVYTPVHEVLTSVILIGNFAQPSVVAWIHHLDTDRDIAVLKYDRGYDGFVPGVPLFTYDKAASLSLTDFEVGDAVVVVVRKRNDDFTRGHEVIARVGKVLVWGPSTPREPTTAWLSPYDVTCELEVYPGDSGSPVFVFKDGKPIYIGIARAVYDDGVVSFSYFAYFGDKYRHLVAF